MNVKFNFSDPNAPEYNEMVTFVHQPGTTILSKLRNIVFRDCDLYIKVSLPKRATSVEDISILDLKINNNTGFGFQIKRICLKQ